MGKGSRPVTRWRNDRIRKKREREQRLAKARHEARTAPKQG